MKDEEINVAIAGNIGWTRIHMRDGSLAGRPPGVRCEGNGGWIVPNYAGDLNAMHEAERHIPYISGQAYYTHLREIVYRDLRATEESPDFCFGYWHSSARQRAEAFLRTLNKWKEGE